MRQKSVHNGNHWPTAAGRVERRLLGGLANKIVRTSFTSELMSPPVIRTPADGMTATKLRFNGYGRKSC